MILEQQGKLDEADVEHHKAIQLKSPSFDTYDRFAEFVKRRGKPHEAVAVLREAVRMKPDDAWRRSQLALILKAQGKRDEALAELRETMRLKPQSVWVLGLLEEALSELGKPDDVVNLRQDQVERARKLFGPAAPGTAAAYGDARIDPHQAGQMVRGRTGPPRMSGHSREDPAG